MTEHMTSQTTALPDRIHTRPHSDVAELTRRLHAEGWTLEASGAFSDFWTNPRTGAEIIVATHDDGHSCTVQLDGTFAEDRAKLGLDTK